MKKYARNVLVLEKAYGNDAKSCYKLACHIFRTRKRWPLLYDRLWWAMSYDWQQVVRASSPYRSMPHDEQGGRYLALAYYEHPDIRDAEETRYQRFLEWRATSKGFLAYRALLSADLFERWYDEIPF